MGYRILVAFDGSEQAGRAVNKALEFFGPVDDAQIDIVCALSYGSITSTHESSPAVPINGLGSFYCEQGDIADSIALAKAETLTKLQDKLADTFVGAKCTVTYNAVVASSIAEGIADFAAEAQSDMIFMGCRGLGRVRAAIGSVSLALLKETPTPVMLIK
jgi:nucleotide-binding universal stress UspA family protein